MWTTRIGLLTLLIAALFGARGVRISAMDAYLASREYDDIYYLPPPNWLVAISLGHREALADLIWMKGLIYTGDEFREGGGMSNVFRYTEAMITLDPQFRRAYQWVGVSGLYRPIETTQDDVERTIAFLREGVERFPNDGDMHWDLGTTIQYELVRLLEGDEKDAAEREATRHMTIAMRLGAGPEYQALSNARRLVRHGELSAAIRHLEEMYPIVDDETIRGNIAAQLADLRGQESQEAVVTDREHFEARWRRDYPWLPPGFYALVGARDIVPEGRFPAELLFGE